MNQYINRLKDVLICLECRQKVKKEGDFLVCPRCQVKYPIVQGVPIMFSFPAFSRLPGGLPTLYFNGN